MSRLENSVAGIRPVKTKAGKLFQFAAGIPPKGSAARSSACSSLSRSWQIAPGATDAKGNGPKRRLERMCRFPWQRVQDPRALSPPHCDTVEGQSLLVGIYTIWPTARLKLSNRPALSLSWPRYPGQALGGPLRSRCGYASMAQVEWTGSPPRLWSRAGVRTYGRAAALAGRTPKKVSQNL